MNAKETYATDKRDLLSRQKKPSQRHKRLRRMQKRPIHQTKETYQADSDPPLIDLLIMRKFMSGPQSAKECKRDIPT